jgi:WD40 repeat protein
LSQDAEVERLGRVLRLSSHVLAREPMQFAAQLVGRLREESSPGTERLTGAARRNVPPTVLVPRDGKHLVEPGALSATFAGHASTVIGALLLPDGRRVLSLSNDSTLRVWDLESGQGRSLEGHDDSVNGALLLPDGRRALSWSRDNTLRVWDLESAQGRPLDGHSSSVTGALLLPDGRRALSWSNDSTLRVWDLESGLGRPLEGHSHSVDGALLLPDGHRALSWSRDKTLRVWDLESRQGRPLEGHSHSVDGALLLPDGRRALSWSADDTLRVWDLEVCSETARFVGDDPITCVVLAPEKKMFVAGDARGRVMFFPLPD